MDINMRTDYKTSNLSIWEYNSEEKQYQLIRGIPWDDVLNYDFVARDYNDADEFSLSLKIKEEYQKYVPTSEKDFATLSPMIIVKMVKGQVIWFSFIIGRSMKVTGNTDEYIQFLGAGLTHFNEFKLVGSNLDFKNTDDNLPEDFATYKANKTFDEHLRYMYANYTNPYSLTYGRKVTAKLPVRQFKGLRQVTIDYDNKTKKEIQFEQQSIRDALEQTCNEYNYEPVTRQVFELGIGQFSVNIHKPKALDLALVRKISEIVERFQDQEMGVNYIFAHGWGNNDINVYKTDKAYFTTMETIVDLSDSAKKNKKYLDTMSRSNLETLTKNRITYALKIMSNDLFTNINCGDVLTFDSQYYKVVTIRESDSVSSGQTFDVEIKLTDKNGITIKESSNV